MRSVEYRFQSKTRKLLDNMSVYPTEEPQRYMGIPISNLYLPTSRPWVKFLKGASTLVRSLIFVSFLTF